MEVKVTKPQVKKLLEQHGEVELDLYEKGKDPNHYMTAILQITVRDMSEFDERLPEVFKEFSGRRDFSMAIWKDDENEGE